MSEKKHQNLTIRNSTAEFLVFTQQAGEGGIEVRYENETIWLSQQLIAELFDVQRPAITKQLKNISESGELEQDSACANFARTTSAEIAKSHAANEFEKYRIIQDRLFESDFDKEIKEPKKRLVRRNGGKDETK